MLQLFFFLQVMVYGLLINRKRWKSLLFKIWQNSFKKQVAEWEKYMTQK